jgi:hypothetical protein
MVGGGLGCDVLSFDEADEAERLVEVKTTGLGVRHLVHVHPSLHAELLPQGHPAVTRLTDVVEARLTNSPDVVQTWYIRDGVPSPALSVRFPQGAQQDAVDVNHGHRSALVGVRNYGPQA